MAVIKQRQNVEQERENLLKIKDANDKMLERRKRMAQSAADSFAEASGEQKVKISLYHDALRKQIQELENANNDIDNALKNLLHVAPTPLLKDTKVDLLCTIIAGFQPPNKVCFKASKITSIIIAKIIAKTPITV